MMSSYGTERWSADRRSAECIKYLARRLILVKVWPVGWRVHRGCYCSRRVLGSLGNLYWISVCYSIVVVEKQKRHSLLAGEIMESLYGKERWSADRGSAECIRYLVRGSILVEVWTAGWRVHRECHWSRRVFGAWGACIGSEYQVASL